MKKWNNNKTAHAFKGFVSSYVVEVLNSFILELHLKDTESTFKNNLKKLLIEL